MADVNVVTPGDLGSDFRGVGTKIVNDSVVGGNGAPAAPPAEVDKIWLWWDTAAGSITHAWSVALGQWVSLSAPVPPLDVVSRKIPGDFATGSQAAGTTIQARNCTITNTALGRYTITFASAHPDGENYEVVYGCEEPSNTRDVPKASTVAGSRTANGFEIQVTVDDNGGSADSYSNDTFSFAVKTTITIVESVSYA